MKRVLLFLVVAVASLVSVAAAGATNDPPTLPPQASPTAGVAIVAPVQRVSVAEALAAARRPGAVTEITPGVTLVDPDPCWSTSIGMQWGIWPQERRVYANDYWCAPALGAPLSYRSTTVTTSTTLCNSTGTYSFKDAGGYGYPTVTYTAGAYFSCPSGPYPWLAYHFNQWHEDELSSWGAAFIVAHN